MNFVGKVIAILFFPFAIVLLIGLIWTWVRFLRMRQRTVFSSLSLVALALATSTVPFAFLSSFHAEWFDFAQHIGPLVSLVGLLFAFGGALRPNPVRWQTLACVAGMFVFWITVLISG